jgi:hypothetical protein
MPGEHALGLVAVRLVEQHGSDDAAVDDQR